MKLMAPFPWYGGKSAVADEVWRRLGDVDLYVEPFFGSGAVLLARPHKPRTEIVNDKDGLLMNFWRAIRKDPERVLESAERIPAEVDLVAWSRKLAKCRPLVEKLLEDPEWCDVELAGVWLWGQCHWLGQGWADSSAGRRYKQPHFQPHGYLVGLRKSRDMVLQWFKALQQRLRDVIVLARDWKECVEFVAKPWIFDRCPKVGIFLDPPYDERECDDDLYPVDSKGIFREVLQWCLEMGKDRRLRIALCGFEGPAMDGWSEFRWVRQGGMSSVAKKHTRGKENRFRERIWFSPGCQGKSLLELIS